MHTILFLCTGNYYRSRFAELLFNHLARRAGIPWRAVSRGLAVHLGGGNKGPIAPVVIDELKRRGITVDGVPEHAVQATPDDFSGADIIVAMNEPEHRPIIEKEFPAWKNRVRYWDIEDVGGELPEKAMMRVGIKIHDVIAALAGNRHPHLTEG